MTRILAIIAVTGFVVATACFGGVVALGGRDLARVGWFFPWTQGGRWEWEWDNRERAPERAPDAREIVFDKTVPASSELGAAVAEAT